MSLVSKSTSETIVSESAFERSLTRRGFVGWAGKVSLGIVGSMAALVALGITWGGNIM